MSLESASAFFTRINTDAAFRSQFRTAASDDQRRSLIQASGYEFTPEEWSVVIEQARQMTNRELDDSELETIAGGAPFPMVAIYGLPPEFSWPF